MGVTIGLPQERRDVTDWERTFRKLLGEGSTLSVTWVGFAQMQICDKNTENYTPMIPKIYFQFDPNKPVWKYLLTKHLLCDVLQEPVCLSSQPFHILTSLPQLSQLFQLLPSRLSCPTLSLGLSASANKYIWVKQAFSFQSLSSHREEGPN